MSALTAYYAQALEDEREQFDAVNEALECLNVDGLRNAAEKIGSATARRVIKRVTELREVDDAIVTLEAHAGFHKARIEYLKPLEKEERERELAEAHRAANAQEIGGCSDGQ